MPGRAFSVDVEQPGKLIGHSCGPPPTPPTTWPIGPGADFTVVLLGLSDQPAYRTGVVIVRVARCIAMVVVWNEPGGGGPLLDSYATAAGLPHNMPPTGYGISSSLG